MTQPTPFELKQADIARKANAKGYTLVTHLRFSLLKDGRLDPKEAETLDDIERYLDTH